MNEKERISDEKLYDAVQAALVGTGFSMTPSFVMIYCKHVKHGFVFEIRKLEFNPEFIRLRLDEKYENSNFELIGTKEFDTIISTVIRQQKITNLGF